MQWLSLQHVCDTWCSTAETVEAQTNYFVGASYFERKRIKVTLNVWLR